MPRNLHADVIAELDADHLDWITLIEIAFDSVTLRLCNRLTSIEYAGNVYSGLGAIGTVGSISENITLDPEKCNITLSGVDSVALGVMVNNDHLGRSVSIKYALLDASSSIIGEPVTHFDGTMSSLEVSYGKKAEVQIEAADQLADWDRIYPGRLTDEDHRALYPGDYALAYLSTLHKKEIIWPRD